MKKYFFLSVAVLVSALTYTHAQVPTATSPEAAHWSVALKGGIDYFNIKPVGKDLVNNASWCAGISIERTVNPLVGYGLNLDLLNYNRTTIRGYTIDPTFFTSVNLSNLLCPSRKSAKVNFYSNFGAGASFANYKKANFGNYYNYPPEGSKTSAVAYTSLAMEANLSKVMALGLEAGYRGYITPESPYLQYNDAYTLMASLRFKLGTGSKTHVRDMTRADYYPAPAPVIVKEENAYDDSKIMNRLYNLDRLAQDTQDRLSKLEADVKNLVNMPNGTAINAAFENIEFEYDSDVITNESKPILDNIVNILKTYPTWNTLKVMGHTDSRGAEAYNQGLSERRVKSVEKYLIDNGLDAAKIATEGFGETQPIAPNNTAEGRQKNRRVVFEIVK